jgi:hypothetical protein
MTLQTIWVKLADRGMSYRASLSALILMLAATLLAPTLRPTCWRSQEPSVKPRMSELSISFTNCLVEPSLTREVSDLDPYILTFILTSDLYRMIFYTLILTSCKFRTFSSTINWLQTWYFHIHCLTCYPWYYFNFKNGTFLVIIILFYKYFKVVDIFILIYFRLPRTVTNDINMNACAYTFLILKVLVKNYAEHNFPS